MIYAGLKKSTAFRGLSYKGQIFEHSNQDQGNLGFQSYGSWTGSELTTSNSLNMFMRVFLNMHYQEGSRQKKIMAHNSIDLVF